MEAVTTIRIKNLKNRTAKNSCTTCRRLFDNGDTVYLIDGAAFCTYCGNPDEAARISDFSRGAVIERIRKALKARTGKAWSVKGGKGTAYGWIRIDAPKARQTWRHVESGERDSYGLPIYTEVEDLAYRFGHMSQSDRAELAAALGIDQVHHQGVQIPSGHDFYAEFIDRAEGREVRDHGQQYWD